MERVRLRDTRIGPGQGAFLAGMLLVSACKSDPEPRAEPTTTAAAASVVAALEVGSPAPDVALPLQDGKSVSLKELRGKPLVLYFYPKDDTPGCTVEAQGIRDAYQEFEKAGARVFGVSTQGADSHRDFIEKYDLPFDLVVDVEGKVASAFGVPVNNGKAARQTFLIDKEGKLAQIWRDVRVDDHAREILAKLSGN